LEWSLHGAADADTEDEAEERVLVGLRLCTALALSWHLGGYFAERRRWLQLAVERAGDRDSPELARCLSLLSSTLRLAGDLDPARARAMASVEMWRRLEDDSMLAMALTELADVEAERGDLTAARTSHEEAVRVARKAGSSVQLRVVLGEFAILEASEGHHERSLELDAEALAVARELADPIGELTVEHNIACTLREMGRLDEAHRQIRNLVPRALELAGPGALTALSEDYAAILAELGDLRSAVRLLGAADSMRERLGSPRHQVQAAEIAGPLAKAHQGLTEQAWQAAYAVGRGSTLESALRAVEGLAASEERPLVPAPLAE
jgi:tetratricopeptide (TPR) repeat protein